MGSGGMGSGGGAEPLCTELICSGSGGPTPSSEECFEFEIGPYGGGFQVSNADGCTLVFDGEAITAVGSVTIDEGTHVLEFSGCSNSSLSWSCWGSP